MLSAKRPQLRRLLLIERELKAERFPTIERLAELAEAHPRTIRRDLEFLRDQLAAPLEFCRLRNGWHYTDNSFQLPHLQMTEGELVALFLAEQTLRQHRGTPYEKLLVTALKKLTALLPDEISVQWDAVAQAHSFRSSVVSLHDVDIFRRLAEALLKKRQLRIDYWTASRDALTTRVIDPWHLTCIDGAWFLVAWCHLRQAARTFSPARIRRLEETGQSFAVPASFSITEFLDGSFKVFREDGAPLRTVRLRFAPSAARFIAEKVWHASQRLTPHADGAVTLELSLCSLVEVRRWVLSWGAECEVLAPPELRDDIRNEALRMLSPAAAPPLKRAASRTRRRSKAEAG